VSQEHTYETLAKTFTVKALPESEVEISGEIPFDMLTPHKEHALSHIAAELDIPGFRKGHVPTDIALKKVGEIAILEEAVEHFMQDFYPVLVAAQNVDAVGRPNIRITKLAPLNPVGIVITAAIYPNVELPKNWKTVGNTVAPEEAVLVTEEDVDKTIESLRQSRAVREEGKEPVIPEITDEFAKTLGAFENVAALKEQIKKGIGEEKTRAAKEARRGRIIDALLKDIKVEVPRIFVEAELEKIIAQLKDDIARFNIPYEEYLKRTGKNEEELKNDFREQARKRALLQLALNKIAEVEDIKPDKEMVESEIKHALEHFPDARPELLRIHIETVLRNEKVLSMLEGENK